MSKKVKNQIEFLVWVAIVSCDFDPKFIFL